MFKGVAGQGYQYADMVLGGFAVLIIYREGFGQEVLKRLVRRGFNRECDVDNVGYLSQRIK